MAASIQTPVEAQPNLGLPFAPELRNEIYKLVLSNVAQRKKGGGPDTDPLQLLLISRQTNIEACAMYYSHNNFHFPTLRLLARFLWNIGAARRANITSLSFVYTMDDPMPNSITALLMSCTSWKHLSIQARVWPDDLVVPRSLAGVLSKVRGMESVQFRYQGQGRPSGYSYWTAGRRQRRKQELSWEALEQLMIRPRESWYRPGRLVKPYQSARELAEARTKARTVRRSARLQELREMKGV